MVSNLLFSRFKTLVDKYSSKAEIGSSAKSIFLSSYKTLAIAVRCFCPPDNSLAFFDDHQNAYNRLKQCSWYGFKHTIFEDNYPVKQGDCYSLKKAFSGSGFNDSSHLKNHSFFQKVFSRLEGRDKITEVQPNNFDSNLLHKHLEIYSEFPPIFKSKYTRWSDEWEDKHYPTPPPVLTEFENIDYKIYQEEAMFYTWICYAKLK